MSKALKKIIKKTIVSILFTGSLFPGVVNGIEKKLPEKVEIAIGDIITAKVALALKQYPEIKGVTFAGGVACNKFLREKLQTFCATRNMQFIAPHPKYCGDNAAMVAFVGGYKAEQGVFADLSLDVYE